MISGASVFADSINASNTDCCCPKDSLAKSLLPATDAKNRGAVSVIRANRGESEAPQKPRATG